VNEDGFDVSEDYRNNFPIKVRVKNLLLLIFIRLIIYEAPQILFRKFSVFKI